MRMAEDEHLCCRIPEEEADDGVIVVKNADEDVKTGDLPLNDQAPKSNDKGPSDIEQEGGRLPRSLRTLHGSCCGIPFDIFDIFGKAKKSQP